MATYHFITRWHLKAPLSQVWEAILLSEEWPNWWNDIAEVTETEPGNENGIGSVRIYRMKTALPYTLKFGIRLRNRTEYQLLAGEVFGDLRGTGSWHFSETAEGTLAECRWDVATTVFWMNVLSFLLRPFFAYNHALVMRRGAKDLARHLNAPLLSC